MLSCWSPPCIQMVNCFLMDETVYWLLVFNQLSYLSEKKCCWYRLFKWVFCVSCVSLWIEYILILAICLDKTGIIANSAYSSWRIRYFIALFPPVDHNYPGQYVVIYDTFWHLFWHIVQRVICCNSKPDRQRNKSPGEKKRLPISNIKLTEKGAHSV